MTICAECRVELPAEDLVSIKGVSVCATCKPGYLKRLQEGSVDAGGFIYKGFWNRFVAKFVDGIITQLASFLIGLGLGLAMSNQPGMLAGVSMLVGMIIGFGYPIIFNGKFGATPGKMMISAHIINTDGSPIGYGKATARTFCELISAFTLGFGYMMAGWDPQKRTLHDRICGTLVVQK